MEKLKSFMLVVLITLIFHNTPALGIQFHPEYGLKDTLQLTLPPNIYCTEDVPTTIYFDNIILSKNSRNFKFKVYSPFGSSDSIRWTVNPEAKDTGNYTLAVSVSDSLNNFIDSTQCQIVVTGKKNKQSIDSLRILMIGNSLSNPYYYPGALIDSFLVHENIEIVTLGSKVGNNNVRTEGWSGTSWEWFIKDPASPFTDDSGILNVSKYIEETCNNVKPDLITFELGVNDCFLPATYTQGQLDKAISDMLANADILIKEFLKMLPNARIGIFLTMPGNSSEEAFAIDYQNFSEKYTAWGMRTIQHQLVTKYIEYIKQLNEKRVSIIPSELNIDRGNDYDYNSGIHPNAMGHFHIASTAYSWLKYTINNKPTTTSTQRKDSRETIPLECVNSYPNPFNSSTKINYSLAEDGPITIEIYNALGKKINSLINDYQRKGMHSVSWDGVNDFKDTVPSGIYFIRISTNKNISTIKTLLLK